MLAGPNGAGKSTFFDLHLRATGLPFVNADLIARAIASAAPLSASYEAARAADIERQALLERGTSFCMETVFSDRSGAKLAFLERARARGYLVVLVYIGLESPDLAQARVTGRVAAGGHDVPDEKIFARFPRSLRNLREALGGVAEAHLYDNSDADHPFRLVARLSKGVVLERHPPLPDWAMDALRDR